MNVREVKNEIKRTLKLYFEKDEKGNYILPQVKQRPLFLVGPPGIGKTAIIEQVADEEKVALVSYTITHHTRQSAIGLPYIKEKMFNGVEYSTTEYTMSEIIASIYKKIEETDIKEGILFLDEINCVSETLSPMMLQFLQEKKFGNFSMPDGWLIVTAGNPAGYNKSVREFDTATLDRIRQIDVEAEYEVWHAYALKQRVHPAILSFLEIKKDNFYHIETTIDGKKIVTPRGWEDFSILLSGYEKNNFEVNAEIVLEFIKDKRIAVDFINFLDLYRKYEDKYRIKEVLEKGIINTELAEDTSFDEKISVISMLISGLNNYFVNTYVEEEYLRRLFNILKAVKEKEGYNTLCNLEKREQREYEISNKELNKISDKIYQKTLEKLNELILFNDLDKDAFLKKISEVFKNEKSKVIEIGNEAEKALSNAIKFMESMTENKNSSLVADSHMVYFVSELETNYYSMNFIREHRIDFKRYAKLLKTDSARTQLKSEILEILS